MLDVSSGGMPSYEDRADAVDEDTSRRVQVRGRMKAVDLRVYRSDEVKRVRDNRMK